MSNKRYHKCPRLFVEANLDVDVSLVLSKPQSHYLISVMRRKLSDNIILFNGKEGEFLAEITEANKNSVKLLIIEKSRDFIKSPNISLVYSPVKNAKDEFIVQKATELGVSNIMPCIFERTVKSKVKVAKLDLVAVEAAEQCERLDVPVVHELSEFTSLFKSLSDGSGVNSSNSIRREIIFCDETGRGGAASQVLSKLAVGNASNDDVEYIVMIGPEGGFSASEIDDIYSLNHVSGIGLGSRILRADTAIITALSLVQNYLGDFDKLPDFRSG